MIDKNYPARHRLLAKKIDGTQVDGKPFLGNWRAAIDALGLALPGTILFASHVLLVEGPADPILLNAVLQKMAELGLHGLDLNPLSIMPTGDTQNADALARILLESAVSPRVVGLYDGDEGGRKRKAKLEKVILEKDQHVSLAKGKTIEDYLPFFDDLFVKVAAAYAAKTFDVNADQCEVRIRAALNEQPDKGGEQDKNARVPTRIDRVLRAIKEEANLDDEPSKVGIARDYAHALLECDTAFSKQDSEMLAKLAELIQAALKLPPRTVTQNEIIQV